MTKTNPPFSFCARHIAFMHHKEVLQRSYLHCHAKNVHSVGLTEGPGMVRIFIADKDHELYSNRLPFDKQSVAFHSHHRDLALIPLTDNVFNVSLRPATKDSRSVLSLRGWNYDSKLRCGEIRFERTRERNFSLPVHEVIFSCRHLKASELHTIYVPKGEEAAWIVVEGDEAPHYSNECWSNSPLDTEDFSGLYQPMDAMSLSRLLNYL